MIFWVLHSGKWQLTLFLLLLISVNSIECYTDVEGKTIVTCREVDGFKTCFTKYNDSKIIHFFQLKWFYKQIQIQPLGCIENNFIIQEPMSWTSFRNNALWLVKKVMWLDTTNQSALFQNSLVATVLWNFIYDIAPCFIWMLSATC